MKRQIRIRVYTNSSLALLWLINELKLGEWELMQDGDSYFICGPYRDDTDGSLGLLLACDNSIGEAIMQCAEKAKLGQRLPL